MSYVSGSKEASASTSIATCLPLCSELLAMPLWVEDHATDPELEQCGVVGLGEAVIDVTRAHTRFADPAVPPAVFHILLLQLRPVFFLCFPSLTSTASLLLSAVPAWWAHKHAPLHWFLPSTVV